MRVTPRYATKDMRDRIRVRNLRDTNCAIMTRHYDAVAEVRL